MTKVVDIVRDGKRRQARRAVRRRRLDGERGLTAEPDLHLGHTGLIRKMKHLDLGIGLSSTRLYGMIGDRRPVQDRPPLSVDEIAAMRNLQEQVFTILDREKTVVDSTPVGTRSARTMIAAARYTSPDDRAAGLQAAIRPAADCDHEFLYRGEGVRLGVSDGRRRAGGTTHSATSIRPRHHASYG